jgi:predicted nucleic acid-binding protein
MAGVLFDTTLYVAALRRSDFSFLGTRRAAPAGDDRASPLWLSAVVLEELYAGARNRRTRKLCASLEKSFEKVGRLLVPLQTDWSASGQVLARIAQKYGHELIGLSRLTNDTLIAVSAGRTGLTVITENASDFEKIAEFHPFKWQHL